ncbi:MAG: BACON domain-containing protein [Alistipes sp.]|nr:BACON domain-containing protein [Alistipes sp.]
MRIFNYLKQFAVLAVVAMVFVACEPDKPTDKPAKEYALEVKSETTMEFPAEGGEGVIEWALNEVTRAVIEQLAPTFTTEAEWITLNAENLGAFAVAANEGEAREAVINIEYMEQEFAVTVKQAAPAPAPVEATELAVAARIPSEELDLENNVFVLAFADDAESLELGIVLVGEEGTEVLAAGTYNVDNEGLVAEECALQIYTEEGLEEYFFESGEVVVAVDGENYDFDITLATTEGEDLRFTYEGVVIDMVPEVKPAEPVAFTPAAVKAELYEAGNFFLQLYIDDARYHELDMYDVVAPNEDYLSAGLYSYAAETIGSWSTFNRGNDQTCGLAEAEITLAHNDDNTTTITGFIKSEEGDHITIDWTGVIEGMKLADEPENPTDGTFFNFVSANVCWMGQYGWQDFQIAFTDANGVVLTCDFYACTQAETNYLPDGEYLVAADYKCVYSASYSFIDLNDGGPLQDLQSGKVIVAEVDGQYKFTFENIAYGADLKTFNGVYVGQVGSTAEGVSAMVVPSEYKAPEISDEVTELTIYSWFESFNGENEHELNFVYDSAAMRVVVITRFTYLVDNDNMKRRVTVLYW